MVQARKWSDAGNNDKTSLARQSLVASGLSRTLATHGAFFKTNHHLGTSQILHVQKGRYQDRVRG